MRHVFASLLKQKGMLKKERDGRQNAEFNRCGVCVPCQEKECGSCQNCLKMITSGGRGVVNGNDVSFYTKSKVMYYISVRGF